MSHLDDDTLAAIALGDPATPAAHDHVDTCATCASRLQSFTELTSALDSIPGIPRLEAPPERVWSAIASEIAEDATSQAKGVASVRSLAVHREVRNRRGTRLLAVAASGAVILLAGAAVFGLLGRGEDSVTLASAPLKDLAEGTSAGTAAVVERSDGTTVLVVDTDFAQPTDAALEVWLIDPQIEGMISVGYLTGDHGEYVIPAGFDVAAFPIVDISIEPHDGVPTHSGVSITRGVLNV